MRRLLVIADDAPGSSDAFVVGEVAPLAEQGWPIVLAAARASAPALVMRYPAGLRVAIDLAPPRLAGSLAIPSKAYRAARGAARGLATQPARTMRALRSASAERTGSAVAVTLASFPFDAIWFESAETAARLHRAASLFGVPHFVRVSPRDVIGLEIAAPRARAVASAIDAAAGAYCVSDDLRRRIAAVDTALADQLTVVVPPGGVARRAASRNAHAPLSIAMVAPLEYPAGYELVLVALAQLAARGIGFQLRVIGAGSLDRYLKFSSDSLGLGDRVEWIGAADADRIEELLSTSDCYITSLLEESTEYPATRALAAGCALVSGSTAAEATDLVRAARAAGGHARTVACRDSAQLAELLAELATNGPLAPPATDPFPRDAYAAAMAHTIGRG